MPDLSVLIPSRNEQFLQRTIDAVFAAARADTEVIAVLDGEWPDQPLSDHPKLRVTHSAAVIGQRAATNLAASMSRATYLMKLDAHCSLDDGFDVKLIAADQELGRPDLTQIPAQVNLHAFNWRCRACGRETYQGPLPSACVASPDHDRELAVMPAPCGQSAGFDRVMVWAPRRRRAQGNGSEGKGGLARTEFWRFDHTLHFQYHGPRAQGEDLGAELADVMSSVGACFFMRRARFHEIGGLDEQHGSWGNFGTEIACKSWLSGGRHIVNRRTWFSHLFRTQGGSGADGFSFPYPMRGSDQEYARRYSQNLWMGNHWEGQRRPLSWLLDHFSPIRGWDDPEGAEQRVTVMEAGRRFSAGPRAQQGAGAVAVHAGPSIPSKGLIYYSDCRGDARILQAVRDQLVRASAGLPIVSVTLQPLDFGRNIVLSLERGYLTMFKQILAGLEALDTDIAFLVEHDVLYHPCHFDFRPPRDDVFYFNRHRYQVRATDGFTVHYPAAQTSGCCANRQLLVEHYRKRVAHVEQHGYDRNLGFEPGTNRRARALDPHGAAHWFAAWPNIDIRHGHNLSRSKWSVADFRDQRNAQGFRVCDTIPGWGLTLGRFDAFLADVAQGRQETAA